MTPTPPTTADNRLSSCCNAPVKHLTHPVMDTGGAFLWLKCMQCQRACNYKHLTTDTSNLHLAARGEEDKCYVLIQCEECGAGEYSKKEVFVVRPCYQTISIERKMNAISILEKWIETQKVEFGKVEQVRHNARSEELNGEKETQATLEAGDVLTGSHHGGALPNRKTAILSPASSADIPALVRELADLQQKGWFRNYCTKKEWEADVIKHFPSIASSYLAMEEQLRVAREENKRLREFAESMYTIGDWLPKEIALDAIVLTDTVQGMAYDVLYPEENVCSHCCKKWDANDMYSDDSGEHVFICRNCHKAADPVSPSDK